MAKIGRRIMPKYDLDNTKLGTLLDDPKVVEILEKHAPGLTSNPMLNMARDMTVGQALGMAGGVIGQDKVEAIQREVEQL
jgi:hypothetical protein